MPIEFSVAELLQRVRVFIDIQVIPREAALAGRRWLPADMRVGLQDAAREAALFATFMLAEYGGLAHDPRGQAACQETSVAKGFVAEAVGVILDRSVQLCGGLIVSADRPLACLLSEVRPFRIYDCPSEVHRMVTRAVGNPAVAPRPPGISRWRALGRCRSVSHASEPGQVGPPGLPFSRCAPTSLAGYPGWMPTSRSGRPCSPGARYGTNPANSD